MKRGEKERNGMKSDEKGRNGMRRDEKVKYIRYKSDTVLKLWYSITQSTSIDAKLLMVKLMLVISIYNLSVAIPQPLDLVADGFS